MEIILSCDSGGLPEYYIVTSIHFLILRSIRIYLRNPDPYWLVPNFMMRAVSELNLKPRVEPFYASRHR